MASEETKNKVFSPEVNIWIGKFYWYTAMLQFREKFGWKGAFIVAILAFLALLAFNASEYYGLFRQSRQSLAAQRDQQNVDIKRLSQDNDALNKQKKEAAIRNRSGTGILLDNSGGTQMKNIDCGNLENCVSAKDSPNNSIDVLKAR